MAIVRNKDSEKNMFSVCFKSSVLKSHRQYFEFCLGAFFLFVNCKRKWSLSGSPEIYLST